MPVLLAIVLQFSSNRLSWCTGTLLYLAKWFADLHERLLCCCCCEGPMFESIPLSVHKALSLQHTSRTDRQPDSPSFGRIPVAEWRGREKRGSNCAVLLLQPIIHNSKSQPPTLSHRTSSAAAGYTRPIGHLLLVCIPFSLVSSGKKVFCWKGDDLWCIFQWTDVQICCFRACQWNSLMQSAFILDWYNNDVQMSWIKREETMMTH